MEQPLFIFFGVIILIFSAVIHEIFHGLTANALGDDTAFLAGRLTLNPLAHLDFWGSFIIPVSIFIVSSGNFIFGWAKPVPYNPDKLKYLKWGPAFVALAGPLVNIVIAVFFGLGQRFLGGVSGLETMGLEVLMKLFSYIILINLGLAIFNLVPIPPLDGSKVLFALLPLGLKRFEIWLENFGFALLLLFIFFGIGLLIPVIRFFFQIITGQALSFF